MNLEKEFPLRFWINLGKREDRRVAMQRRLSLAGISAERFPGVDAERHRAKWPATDDFNVRGYNGSGRYALSLSQRLAIREAKRRKAAAVLLLEDDAVFHPNFAEIVKSIELPDDWGIFYFGCTHTKRPQLEKSRIVKADMPLDTHAIAIRDIYYDQVIRFLNRHHKGNPGVARASDQFLALLSREIPTYAVWPNLIWQSFEKSDLKGTRYTNYTSDGRQKSHTEAVESLLDEITGSDRGSSRRKVKLGLLFLTRDDVNHPQIWREFVSQAPERVRIFSHSKRQDLSPPGNGEGLAGALRPFLDGTSIDELHETEWGDISLVRATRALLLSALEDESITHFILLSESCVPAMPLREMLRRLQIDPRPQFDYQDLEHTSDRNRSRIHAVPEVPAGCWRFQSQWWLMDRPSARIATGRDFTKLFEKMYVPDEAYFATVLAMQGYPLDGEVFKTPSTWTWWNDDAGSPTAWEFLPREKAAAILKSGAFFARKFPEGADIGKYQLHLIGS